MAGAPSAFGPCCPDARLFVSRSLQAGLAAALQAKAGTGRRLGDSRSAMAARAASMVWRVEEAPWAAAAGRRVDEVVSPSKSS
jgi:hypothetical protein